MSFRRNGKSAKHWNDWRARHSAMLSRCGLPAVFYRDAIAWENFLVDGYLPAGCGAYSGWSVDLLSPEQVRLFAEFLEQECRDHPFQQSMLNMLRRRAAGQFVTSTGRQAGPQPHRTE